MLQWHFCGNFPKSHLPLKLYSRLMLVPLVTCGSQIFSAHQPLNRCDGVSVWLKKKKKGGEGEKEKRWLHFQLHKGYEQAVYASAVHVSQ